MEKCNHFEWIDDYVTRRQREGLLDLNGAATRELNLPSAVENLVSHSVATTVVDADLMGELKKMNKNLKKMIELNKQANLIALGFYICIVSLALAYLLIISR